MERDDLLGMYDAALRGAGEMPPTATVVRHGPLYWGRLGGREGFVSYHGLDAVTGADLEALVAATVEHFRADRGIDRFEWKTCSHDRAPGLHELLVAAGLVAEEPETVMLGRADLLAVDVPLPEGVSLRTVTEPDDVRRMCASADEAFGAPSPGRSEELVARLAAGLDDLELWVAESAGEIVSVGRLERVAGTAVAGLWGGATLPAWRGRGLYRALVAARATSALDRGVEWLHSDCTEASRPILERAGLVRVTTTTPYVWSR